MKVASDFEQQTGSVNKDEYDKHIATLRDTISVKELGPDVRAEWADSLAEWPASVAVELDADGLPASEVLRLTLEAAESNGYDWPVRYNVSQ